MSTYTDASLIYYPSGVKAGKAYSLKPTDGSGDLTFTRASTATRVNESGLIEEVAANVPRLNTPLSGGCSSLLLEPQRTNLITQSTNTSAMFPVDNSVVTSNVDTAPDGTLTADKISGISVNLRGDFVVTTSTTYTFSFYCKNNGGTEAKYQIYDVTNGADIIGITSYFADINDSTYSRVIITFTTPVSCVNVRFFIARSETDADRFVWGYQLEVGSYPTSYIPTTTTAVTRVKDISNTNGLSTIINSVEGTIIFKSSAASIAERGGISIGQDLLSSQRISFYYAPGNILVVTAVSGGAGISTLVYNYASINHIDEHCFGIVYSASGLKLFRDGALVKSNVNSASFPVNTFNSFNLFSDDVSYPLYGKLQQALIFQTVLSDAELIALTTL